MNRQRQPEDVEAVRAEEGSDGADAVAAQTEHGDRPRFVAALGVGADIERDRGLAVRPGVRCFQLGQRVIGTWRAKSATALRPRYQCGNGGIVHVTSSVSIEMNVSMSSCSRAVAKRAAMRRASSSSTLWTVDVESGVGAIAAMVRRARARAEFTDVVLVTMISAISAAEKPRTSKSRSAARWLPGRCWSAATNANSSMSLRSVRSSGCASGKGVSQSTSVNGAESSTV